MTSPYHRDFDFLTQAVTDGYVFLKRKEKEWGFRFEDVKERCARRLPTVSSDFAFWLLLKELVAPLHDSHTWIGFDAPWEKDRRALPCSTTCISGRCFVTGWREGVAPFGGICPGDELLSIDAFDVAELQNLCGRYEGLSTRGAQARMWALQLFSHYIPDVDPDVPAQVELLSADGERRSRELPWVQSPAPVFKPSDPFSGCWLQTTPRLGYLRLHGFFLPGAEGERLAAGHLDRIFSDIGDADGLVLDARGSGGGTFGPMKELISRLISEPVPNFRRRWLLSNHLIESQQVAWQFPEGTGLTDWVYDGSGDLPLIEPSSNPRLHEGVPIIVITDFLTLSRTEELIVLLREAGVAKTLGEKTGGGWGVPLQVVLPDTGWGFKYSVCEGLSAKGMSIEGRGVEPDYPVAPRPEDLLGQTDPCLSEATGLLIGLVR